jgi:hypothetical protein
MAFVASLLSLQKRKVAADPAAAAIIFDEAVQRLQVMGQLHRKLHDPSALDRPIGEYLRELCADLIEAGGATNVRCLVNADEVRLDLMRLGLSALAGERQPPFFSRSYFLALTMVERVVFAAVAAWGVSLRRRTEWHRRAMLGALVVILEPALGRVLPMPLMNGWGEWTIVALQILAS